ncbi:MAG: choice-of-anchor D domain-containing protein [Verrucomicrobia bacterium]|nr:choice-of-anchor D domain-containing protein [Verrucomicrobiota bacterium]
MVRLLDACKTRGGDAAVGRALRSAMDLSVGTPVEIALGKSALRGVVDSALDEGTVKHCGFELEDGLGRMVLSVREDGLLLAHTFFHDEEVCLKWDNTPEHPEVVRVGELAYWQVICANPGTRYPAKGEALTAEAGAELTIPFVPSPGTPNSPVAPLESLPGARAVLYLDLDGETVAHPAWNQGQPINAAPHPNYTNATWVTNVWKRVSEDYAPFAINVTTKRSVYDAAPANKRMMAVVTPTRQWLGSSQTVSGIAFLEVFPFGIPCFIFTQDEYSCADTISHEAGHTFGLSHDGRDLTPSDPYYGGHGIGETGWAPLMGAAWSDEAPSSFHLENVTQWSRNDYPDGNNPQDDLAVIASSLNAFGYRLDDKGGTLSGAMPLAVRAGIIADAGIIERSNDVDMMSFVTGSGTVSIQASPINVNSTFDSSMGANLAIKLKLYDAAGALIQEVDEPGSLSASLTRTLAAGNYFLSIEGAARGTLATGFPKYASLGQYHVSGTLAPVLSDTLPPVVAISTPGSGTVSTAEIEFAGTATDNIGVRTVEVRVNGGAWLPAVGTETWTARVTLVAGPNLLEARAADAKDNVSSPVSRSVTLALSAARITLEQPAGTVRPSGLGAVTFASRAVGQSQSKLITLRNTGQASLTGLALSIEGPDAGDFSHGGLSGTTLAPGATATVSVSVSPTAEGTRSAKLRVASNDPTKQPYEIGLTGSGRPDIGTSYLWTNFAGMPGGPGSGDGVGGEARLAEGDKPMACDAAGNLYIADTRNYTIRKVNPDGAVTTLAGSPGKSGSEDGAGGFARFQLSNGMGPISIVADSLGNVYVCEDGPNGSVIRKITPAGVVSTIYGYDIAGYEFDPETGPFTGVFQIAGSDGNGNIFVAYDDWNWETGDSWTAIKKIDSAGNISTVKELRMNLLLEGKAIKVNRNGKFLLAANCLSEGPGGEWNRGAVVFTFSANEEPSILAGSLSEVGSIDGWGSDARFYFDAPVGFSGEIFGPDAANNFYVINYSESHQEYVLRKITLQGDASTVPVDARFAGENLRSTKLCFDATGNTFYSVYFMAEIFKQAAGGGVVSFAGSSLQSGYADGQGTQARFNLPEDVTVDIQGNVYVADTQNHTIRKISPTGAVSTFAGTPGQKGDVNGARNEARFGLPRAVHAEGSGNVLAANAGAVKRIDSGGNVSLAAQILPYQTPVGDWRNPCDLVIDYAGVVRVRALAGAAIFNMTPQGLVSRMNHSDSSEWILKDQWFATDSAGGLAVNAQGILYLTDKTYGLVRKVSPDGVVTPFAGSPGLFGSNDGIGDTARFEEPHGIDLDGYGNAYVTDRFCHTIRRITPMGAVTTIGGKAGQGTARDGIGTASRFSGPTGICITSSGVIYVADTNNNRVVKGTPLSAAAEVPPLASWRFANFGTMSNSGSAADSADPDRDAMSNLLEFVLNGNPNQPDLGIQPVQRRTGNLVRFTYTRRTDAVRQGLAFFVEWSADLSPQSWTTFGTAEKILSDDGVTQDIEVSVPARKPNMFLRLRVSSDA